MKSHAFLKKIFSFSCASSAFRTYIGEAKKSDFQVKLWHHTCNVIVAFNYCELLSVMQYV